MRLAGVVFAVASTLLTFQNEALGQGSKDSSSQSMPGMNHGNMNHGDMDHMSMQSGQMNKAETFLMGESSGTEFQPSAWKMPMLMTNAGNWHLMWMAQGFIVDTQQSGQRGGDKLYSTNWGMLGAVHRLGRGSIMLRTMLSLEPATVSGREYPLLLQSGETAFGRPIVDGQHPHNLFMEIALQYAHPLGDSATWTVYYAPVGEPALGPTPYPHRASAAELPQATLGHHWEDSTHIAYNVVTSGITYRKVRLEASGFLGREPGENRWTIGYGGMDSWATRVSVYPTKNWAGQVSVGRLHTPEALEPGDQVRTTASVQYIRPIHHSSWATSMIWGQDYKTVDHHRTNTVTAETVIPIRRKDFITGRYEWSQRDELFSDNPQLAAQISNATGEFAFPINAFTVGYTRDIDLFRDVQSGLGANISTYAIDSVIQPYYGSHPWGVNVFFRFRLRPST